MITVSSKDNDNHNTNHDTNHNTNHSNDTSRMDREASHLLLPLDPGLDTTDAMISQWSSCIYIYIYI